MSSDSGWDVDVVDDVRGWLGAHGEVFAEFLRQDSGCRAYGVAVQGEKWFVKHAVEPRALPSLDRAIELHGRVSHRAVIGLKCTFPTTLGPALVHPWRPGESLYPASASEKAPARRFSRLPPQEMLRAVDDVIDAHVAICAAGFVAVDLYDGCFLYDFDTSRIQLCDLDEYRPGPFTVEGERMPGSRRFMAPEEWRKGAVIDERTTVFNLGRALSVLLGTGDDSRGFEVQHPVVERATQPDPSRRHQTVQDLADDWRANRGRF